jgi:hypothetical protein
MLKEIAQQTFESYQKVRQLVIDTECRYLTDADEVDEKLGFITDSVVYRIMECLGVTDENSDDGFGVILECIQDGDSFEYMIKRLKLNESVVNTGSIVIGEIHLESLSDLEKKLSKIFKTGTDKMVNKVKYY